MKKWKIVAEALKGTACIGAYTFGIAWLCLKVSWWFSALWLIVPVFIIFLVFLSRINDR